MHGLTTLHDTVLCFDRAAQRVVHRLPGAIDPLDLVLIEDISLPRFGVIEAGTWRPLDVGLPGAPRATEVPIAACSFGDQVATFRFEHGYLVAPPDGTIRLDGREPLDWETFGLLERASLVDLVDLARHDWMRVDTGDIVRRASIGIRDRLNLRLGEQFYPIAGNLPFPPPATGRRRRLLYRNDWMIDEFVRFRPLVYFVLMGAGPYLEQLRIATRSLVEFGAYDGDVLVITDRDSALVTEALPPALHPRLSILDVRSSDKIDAVLARLMLGDFPGADGYAPILYSDTDVVFDRPIEDILRRGLRGGRMSAQSEPWNKLPASEAAGGDLLSLDPAPLRDDVGFNAGVWMMPGGPDSIQVVNAIRRAVSAYLRTHGRDSLPWLDQAMANYVLRKLDAFDPTLITATTRLCQANYPVPPEEGVGFVHFWPCAQGAAERGAAMQDYLIALRAWRAREDASLRSGG